MSTKYEVTPKGKKLLEEQKLFIKLWGKFTTLEMEIDDGDSTIANIDANWLSILPSKGPMTLEKLLWESGESEKSLMKTLRRLETKGLIKVVR